MSRIGRILFLAGALAAGWALPLQAQEIRGAAGECTRVIFDGDRPLLFLHQDSLGNALSLKAYSYQESLPGDVTHYRSEKDWKRVSYEYCNGELASVTVHTPSGKADSVWIRRRDLVQDGSRAKYRALPQIPDPLTEWKRAQEGALLCEADPLLHPDPLDGTAFLFSTDGRFLCRVRSGYPEGPLLKWRGKREEPLRARFADPVADPLAVGLQSRAVRVESDYVQRAMLSCGAGESRNKGFFKGMLFLARNSGYGGALDFAVREEYGISPLVFYITETALEGVLAHNHFNFGNYLWGASAREASVPLWLARLGAHINNFFLSPDSRGTWDSPDDQLSITAGYHWQFRKE